MSPGDGITPSTFGAPSQMGRRGKRRRPAKLTSDGRRSNSLWGPMKPWFHGGDGDEVTIVRQSDILAIVEVNSTMAIRN